MPIHIPINPKRRAVFKRTTMVRQTPSQHPTSPSTTLQSLLNNTPRIQELSSTSSSSSDSETSTSIPAMAATTLNSPPPPTLPTCPITDPPSTETETSCVQTETLEVLMPFLTGNPNNFPLNSHGLPKLQRRAHVKFLQNTLGDYPEAFAAMDASRPWMLYWALQGLTALGRGVEEYGERVTYTFAAAQHPTGGFGGGHGQLPHLAASYAAILSLVTVGGTAAYESIDRRKMWHFLGRMKQSDGGFTMAPSGEEDIRGAFCALVLLSLLNLPIELPPDAPARGDGLTTFVDGLGEWISKCQTYEGGISAAPGNEAHGAYAFCGLGCLAILGAPHSTLPKYLNLPLLIHWLSSRHCSPEGGYNGRTNKLVDGCYSHWIGSCWAIVEAGMKTTGLWDRTALARYILAAAQYKKGGLVDKPGKRADAYHTCYNLAGLSAVQNRYFFEDEVSEVETLALAAPFKWKVEEGAGGWDGERNWDVGDEVEVVHPVFIVPWGQAEKCRRYFEEKGGF